MSSPWCYFCNRCHPGPCPQTVIATARAQKNEARAQKNEVRAQKNEARAKKDEAKAKQILAKAYNYKQQISQPAKKPEHHHRVEKRQMVKTKPHGANSFKPTPKVVKQMEEPRDWRKLSQRPGEQPQRTRRHVTPPRISLENEDEEGLARRNAIVMNATHDFVLWDGKEHAIPDEEYIMSGALPDPNEDQEMAATESMRL